jgi:hypothetical protein
MPQETDSLTFTGATALADRIRKYWAARGYPNVKTFVTKISIGEQGSTFYCVRSNIGPKGFPVVDPDNDNEEWQRRDTA